MAEQVAVMTPSAFLAATVEDFRAMDTPSLEATYDHFVPVWSVCCANGSAFRSVLRDALDRAYSVLEARRMPEILRDAIRYQRDAIRHATDLRTVADVVSVDAAARFVGAGDDAARAVMLAARVACTDAAAVAAEERAAHATLSVIRARAAMAAARLASH